MQDYTIKDLIYWILKNENFKSKVFLINTVRGMYFVMGSFFLGRWIAKHKQKNVGLRKDVQLISLTLATAAKNVECFHVYFFLYKMY